MNQSEVSWLKEYLEQEITKVYLDALDRGFTAQEIYEIARERIRTAIDNAVQIRNGRAK